MGLVAKAGTSDLATSVQERKGWNKDTNETVHVAVQEPEASIVNPAEVVYVNQVCRCVRTFASAA